MAFKLYSAPGTSLSIEYLPCEAITPKIGLALASDAVNSGQLEVSAEPKYICMTDRETAVAAGTIIPVVRIMPDQIWETTLDGATTLKEGALCDISSDGLEVDADGTTNNNFEIVHLFGTAEGDAVRGRFIK